MTPFLKTKIAVPPLPAHVVARPHLLQRLDDAQRSRCTLVSAPAGFGKTTFVAQWARIVQKNCHVAWLSLDKCDSDPVRFMRYVVAAFQAVDPQFGQSLLSSGGRPAVPNTIEIATDILGELDDAQKPMVLAVDNYDTVDNAEVNACVTYFIDHLPLGIRVILLARGNPTLPLAGWRAEQHLIEIGAEDLLFTPLETRSFLRQTLSCDIDEGAARALWLRTEGWIAALQLAVFSFQMHRAELGAAEAADMIAQFGADNRFVGQYLAAEILRRQPKEIHEFLRTTAILNRFCSSLCNSVTGRADSRVILDHLEQANLLLRLDEHSDWYRYNQLLADFLRSDVDAKSTKEIFRKAADWYERNGHAEQALKYALTGDDLASAVRLIRSQSAAASGRGEARTVLGWLSALPDVVVRANSDLAASKAWLLYLVGRTAEAEEYVKALNASDFSQLPAEQQALVAVFRTYWALNWGGEEANAIPLARQALALLENPAMSHHRITALSFLGQAQSLVGETRAAVDSLRSAYELGVSISKGLDALLHLAPLLQAQGRLQEALHLCRESVEAPQFKDGAAGSLPMAGIAHIALGRVLYETNDLTSAHTHLSTGLALCERMGGLYYLLVAKVALAKLQYARGARDAAWKTMLDARELAERSRSPRRQRMLAKATAEFQLREGDPAAAVRTLRIVQEGGDGSKDADARLLSARLLLVEGRSAHALRSLADLEATAWKQRSDGNLIRIYVLRALANESLRRHEPALEALEKAVRIAAVEGFRRSFLDEGPKILSLLTRVHHVAPEFVDSLLEGAKVKESWSLGASFLPEPLTKTELTLLHLLDHGLRNQEIADKLELTVGTTKQYLNRVFGKLQVRNRLEAAARARQLNLI